MDDLSKLSPDQQFKLIGERLSQIQNPTLKAALAMEVFGKSGTKLLPMFANGATGIEELQQQARDLGLTMSTDDAQAAEAFGDTLDVLWKVLKKTVFTIGSALAPLLTEAAEGFTRVVVTVTNWIKQNKDLVVWVFKIAAAAVAAGAALIVLGTAISGVGAALGAIATVATGIGAAIATLGSIIAAILSPIGLVIAGVVALAGYLLDVSRVGEQALTWLASVFTDLKNDALAAFQGISDALAAGDIGLAAKVLWLTLKIEWQKGINWLQEKWVAFQEFFLSVWTDAVFGLSRIMTNAWAGLQSIWTETVAAMSTAWTVFASGAVSAWQGAQNFIARGIVQLMGMLDDSVDVEATLTTLQEDFQRQQQSRQRDTNQQARRHRSRPPAAAVRNRAAADRDARCARGGSPAGACPAPASVRRGPPGIRSRTGGGTAGVARRTGGSGEQTSGRGNRSGRIASNRRSWTSRAWTN